VYETFEIQNFRGIRNLKLTELGRFNLITGLNDSGKTSVLEALFLHASGPLAAHFTIQTIRPSRSQELAPVGSENPWLSLFHDMDMDIPIRLVSNSGGKSYGVKLYRETRSETQPVPETFPAGDNQMNDLFSVGMLIEAQGAPVAPYRATLMVPNGPNLGFNLGNPIQIRHEPGVKDPYLASTFVTVFLQGNLVDQFSEWKRDPQGVDLLEGLRSIDDRIVNLEVLTFNGIPRLHAVVNNLKMPIPLRLLGSGVYELAKYLLSMKSSKNGTLLIDEVGAGIHHSAYKSVWSVLFASARENNVQIFATTHSQEVVEAAREATDKDTKELSIVRLNREGQDNKEELTATTYTNELLDAAIKFNVDLR
jgi:hypothetical protein